MENRKRFKEPRHEIRCTVLPEVHDAVYLLASVVGKPASRVFSDMIQAGLRATKPLMSESDAMFSTSDREAATAELARLRAIAAIDSEVEVYRAAQRLDEVRRQDAERREKANHMMEERRARGEYGQGAPTVANAGAPSPGAIPPPRLGEDPEAGRRWREKYGPGGGGMVGDSPLAASGPTA